ncbi:MAG: exosome complex exonuclease Rrp41, partial [Nanoarchaeota archaeon]
IMITQANASTRCAGINAASLALAHAGLTMDSLVASVSVGKMDTTLVADVIKEEEDYEEGEGATDIAMAFAANTGQLGLIQMDGCISSDELKKAVEMGKRACEKIAEIQKKVLKERKKYAEK